MSEQAAPPDSRWRCTVCGDWHDDAPLGYGAAEPELAGEMTEDEKDSRVVNDGETCVIDDKAFFIKGSIEIPVEGSADKFVWTVWVSLSEENFVRALDLWHEPARAQEPPYFGWLSTRLPVYPETLELKTHVHTREVGKRPRIELEPTDHPLSVEQRAGITLARVREIAQALLHGP